eukprot:scaffold2100_cov207-Amphora_coffeaeformis.AAC.1
MVLGPDLFDAVLQRGARIVHFINNQNVAVGYEIPRPLRIVEPLQTLDLVADRIGRVVVELQTHGQDGHLEARTKDTGGDKPTPSNGNNHRRLERL